jgi:hypothetical protein
MSEADVMDITAHFSKGIVQCSLNDAINLRVFPPQYFRAGGKKMTCKCNNERHPFLGVL